MPSHTIEHLCNEICTCLNISAKPNQLAPSGSPSLYKQRAQRLFELLMECLTVNEINLALSSSLLPHVSEHKSWDDFKLEVLMSLSKRFEADMSGGNRVEPSDIEPALCISSFINHSGMEATSIRKYLDSQLIWFPMEKLINPVSTWNLILNNIPHNSNSISFHVAVKQAVNIIRPDIECPDLSQYPENVLCYMVKSIVLNSQTTRYTQISDLKKNTKWFKKHNYFCRKKELIRCFDELALKVKNDNELPIFIVKDLITISLRYASPTSSDELAAEARLVQPMFGVESSPRFDPYIHINNITKKAANTERDELMKWLKILIIHSNVHPLIIEREFNEYLDKVLAQ
ncbi:hypothetical protein VCHA53O466_50435 [Vibrio chagasii]|nr:hypothetical protein VCHA53O466_50435 [Vibrio chagasii]